LRFLTQNEHLRREDRVKILEKVHELRKSIHLRSSDAERAFNSRLSRPKKVLGIIEKNEKSISVIYEARRMYVVALACAFEVFWRETVREILDSPKIDVSRLCGLAGIKLSLEDIAEVFHHEMTLGELISCAFPFQGVEQVNRAFSALLGIDAFKEYRAHKFQFLTKDPKTNEFIRMEPMILGPSALKSSKYIKVCFEIRHDTVHNTGTRFKVKPDLISNIEHAMWFFNFTFDMFVKDKFKQLKV
jgi:hypothetical protein